MPKIFFPNKVFFKIFFVKYISNIPFATYVVGYELFGLLNLSISKSLLKIEQSFC